MLDKPQQEAVNRQTTTTGLDWLPWFNPHHIDIINALGSGPRFMKLADQRIRIQYSPQVAPVPDAISLNFAIQDEASRLDVPQALFTRLCALLHPSASVATIDQLQRNILFQFILDRQLHCIEQYLSVPVVFLERSEIATEALALGWLMEIESTTYPLVLHLNPRTARLITERSPGRSGQLLDLPLSLSLCAGSQQLSFAELASLGTGDIILAQEQALNEYRVVLADSYSAKVRAERGKTILSEAFRPISRIWNIAMSNTANEPKNNAQIANLDDLPVQVSFEVGRLDLSFGEISQLTEGSVIPIALTANGNVNIIANGKLIGEGQLVRIGDGLGVQTTRLSHNG